MLSTGNPEIKRSTGDKNTKENKERGTRDVGDATGSGSHVLFHRTITYSVPDDQS